MATTPQGPPGQFIRFCQLLVIANGNPAVPAGAPAFVSSTGSSTSNSVDLGEVTATPGQAATDTSAIDLSSLRIQFEISANDMPIPNTMRVRVYNVAQGTRNKLLQLNKNFQPTVQNPPGAIPAGSVGALVQAGAVSGGNPPQQQAQYIYNKIQLSAGYQNGAQSVLFTGDIITFSFGVRRPAIHRHSPK